MSTMTLPPTVNALDPVERTRLRRSTRKLGEVLGMTPRLLDPIGPIALPSRPSTSGTHIDRTAAPLFFPQTTSITDVTKYRLGELANSPVSVLPIVHKKRKSKQPVRPLVLCLWSAPASDTASPTTGHPLIPRSPSLESIDDYTDLDEADKFRRRKQIAKLTRTLGVNIPPELVLPHHRKCASEPVAKVDKELPPCPPRSTPPLTSPIRPKLRKHRARSLLLSSSAVAHNLKYVYRPSTSDASSGGSAPFFGATMSEGTAEGWNGEWSISDPTQRALALRNLKGK